MSCYTAAVTHKNNLSDQRHSQYWVLPLVTCFASCSMPQQVTSSFSYKAQLLALLAPRTAHFMLRIINLCRLALVSTLVGFMQADKAATDAMAKKIAKPDVPKSAYRSKCLSPALRRKVLPTSTRNTEVASLYPGSHWRPWWGQYPQRSAIPCILSIASASASLYSLKPLDLHRPATLLLCMCVASSHQPVVNFQATYHALCCI